MGTKSQLQSYSTPEAISDNRVLCAMQKYVKTIMGEYKIQPSVIGFKEIRHYKTRELAFFHKVFPCARYIVNTRRNIKKQHKSEFKKGAMMGKLRYQNDAL